MTVVFSDLSGSTALGERLDPESLSRVMTRYYEAMRAVVLHHGGTVEKFAGDAVMAVFGVPVAHEDDALRAVRAGPPSRHPVRRPGLGAAPVPMGVRAGGRRGRPALPDRARRGRVGKTRLLLEAAGRLEDEPAVLVGRCLPYGNGSTFWPLAEMVRQAAGIGLEDPPAVARAKLAALLDRGRRTGPWWPSGPSWTWSSSSPRHLGAPVLLVAVARPELLEQRPAWAGGRPNAVSVLLEPLGADDSGALALTEALAATFEPGYH